MNNIDEEINRLSAELKAMVPPPLPPIDPDVTPVEEAVRITTQWNRDFAEWSTAFDSKMSELEVLMEKVREEDG